MDKSTSLLAKYEYRAQGKMLITRAGRAQCKHTVRKAVQRQPCCPPSEVGAEEDDLDSARLGQWVRAREQGGAETKNTQLRSRVERRTAVRRDARRDLKTDIEI